MTEKWIRVAMKGKAQTIPALCPNCLGEADQKFRYGYRGFEGWLTRTTYYQTFTYCGQCQPQARSADGLRSWVKFAVVVAILAWIILTVTLAAPRHPGISADKHILLLDPIFYLTVVLALAAGALVFLAARAFKRMRHPLRPEQAVWGLAVYYTGGARFGLKDGQAVYKAARPEWIAAFLRANPEQVDDAVYQTLVGAARPAASTERPFGPA